MLSNAWRISRIALRPTRTGAYVAAANRAKSALETYNGADSNAQSLRIMIAAYEELGMNDLATDAQRVLELNFPDS
jgi:outer membrane protein assembly factor BamD